MNVITDWFKRQIANPQVVFLAAFLLALFLVIIYAGQMLMPVLAAIVIAYLLEGLIKRLTAWHIPRLLAIVLVLTLFMLFVLLVVLGLMPLVFSQAKQLVGQIPAMMADGQALLMRLPERYPELFSTEQVTDLIQAIRTQLTDFGQRALTGSLSSVFGVFTVVIYMVLMPILVFFFLKDKDKIIAWLNKMLPRDHQLAQRVWGDVDIQIGNYIRGKFWEILIVWIACYLTFSFLGLHWAMLLAVLVGLSVLIPYVGAVVVTLPVLLVGWFQWGWSSEFIYLMIGYGIVQTLDGNLLVPLLFSEVNNLHPVAIILAVLVFGGLWGLWGVFFAIPLATLVQAVLQAWPKNEKPAENA
ncbi:MAG: AI-2E family transporter [Pseudomonadota bacterium]|nr:AI-2E family transporter [Pseudomonadota bacterium]